MKSAETLRNIKKGAKIGLTFGIVFAITGGVSTALGVNGIADSEATVFSVVGYYLLGGPVAGAAAGSMWWLTRRLGGSILVGIIIGIPLAAGAGVVVLNFTWEPAAIFATLVTALTLGAAVGASFHGIFARRPKGSKGLRKTRR